jgi:hypothetical protein
MSVQNLCAFALPTWRDAGRIRNRFAVVFTTALLRGISETGVPTIETEWVPVSKRSEIGATFTKIAKPTLQCMFEPAK